jgi:ribosomal protein S18 acetylase RimI-like enzyme
MIREATPGEGALIAAEFWYPLAEQMEPYSELNELTDDAVEKATAEFEDLLEADDRYDFFYEEDGAPVGYVSVEVGVRPTRKLGRYADVVDLYVKADYRGEGRGTALLERVESVAEDEDCDVLRVSAEWENDAARRLYERFGYERRQVEYTKTVTPGGAASAPD